MTTARDDWQTRSIAGQPCYVLTTRSVELAITARGGHMAPVTFFPGTSRAIQPYAIAPWAAEAVPDDMPTLIKVLRGDFFCSAFGANDEPVRGQRLPLHGETANGLWHPLERGETVSGCWLKLGMDLPLQGGRCEATTALHQDHSVVYQCHD